MSNINTEESVPVSKIVDLSAFKKKKDTKEEIARSRKPLYVNHSQGSISGSQQASTTSSTSGDFADRLTKIRGSLDRINQLMTEIKKLSVNDGNKDRPV